MRFCILILCLLVGTCLSCREQQALPPAEGAAPGGAPFLIVLGTTQDAGSPQAGCRKSCCRPLWEQPDPERKVVSLGLVDPVSGQSWLFEATPDLPHQIRLLAKTGGSEEGLPSGIFLTHAHIGHYTGLMYLGREALGAHQVPVYAMPRMKSFLQKNGPWDQLVRLDHIELREMKADSAVRLNERLQVIPFRVPHRDEYSETVGFRIVGPSQSALFIPDIDKWSKWNRSIVKLVKAVDYAFLDATFFDANELPGRDMSEIPHPFVQESMETFQGLSPYDKEKIHFIHFNHTNPLLDPRSSASQKVIREGFRIARYAEIFGL